MRTTLTTAIFLVLLAGRQAPPPPVPPAPPPRIFAAIPLTGDSAIEGLVRRLDTGEPLAGAPVVLLGLQDRSGAFPGALSQLEIKTDAAGRFLFEKLPASTYTLRIAPANFFPPPIGGTSASVLSSSVTVSNGQKVSNLAFNLVPGGAIQGLIRDDDGRPAGNISVWALRVAYRDGRKTLENARLVQSDDRGQFRLSGLPPGEYYVRASGTLDGNPILAYYPGGSNVEAAALIRVRGGDEVFADMPIPPTKLFRISGTVVNTIPELTTEALAFVLLRRDRKFDEGSATLLPNLAVGKSSDYFEIRTLPGAYDLITAARATGEGNFYYYTARVPVEVRDRDVEDINVTITRGAGLAIQVSARAAPSVSLPDVRVGLRPVDDFPSGLTLNLGARAVPPDGKVQIGVVPEGKYALVIPVTTPDVYISDIRQNSQSVYDRGVVAVGKETAGPVEVILSANAGRIAGTVEATDKTSGTVRVSLIPEGPRRGNLLFYRRAELLQGRFNLTNIPPGNYKLYAWEDLPGGADENSEFMSAYETRGRAVTVRTGVAISDIALPLIRRLP